MSRFVLREVMVLWLVLLVSIMGCAALPRDRTSFFPAVPAGWTERPPRTSPSPGVRVELDYTACTPPKHWLKPSFAVGVLEKPAGWSMDDVLRRERAQREKGTSTQQVTELTTWAKYRGKGFAGEETMPVMGRVRWVLFVFEHRDQIFGITEVESVGEVNYCPGAFEEIRHSFQLN